MVGKNRKHSQGRHMETNVFYMCAPEKVFMQDMDTWRA
jgi:hypothetical protein